MTVLEHAILDSPLGPLVAAATERGLAAIAYEHGRGEQVLLDAAQRLDADLVEGNGRLKPVRTQLDAYFRGELQTFSLPLDWRLTGPFARRVLQRTTEIPYGRTLAYGEVAAEVGTPRGARAVGNALGSNPLAIVIPCHRVVRAGGALGGYTTGLDKKRFLLRLEGAR